jgi:ATP-dependent Clp protease ATP-binding subunit ClpC
MTKEQQLYFNDPRLKMTSAGRFLIRLFSFLTYGVILAGAVIFSLSDVSFLKSAGILLILFLIDRLLYINKAPRTLVRLPLGKINTANYLLPSSFSILESAFEKANLLGGDFSLYIASKLFERREIKEGLSRMDINVKELEEKLRQRSETTNASESTNSDPKLRQRSETTNTSESTKIIKTVKEKLLAEAGTLVISAFEHAIKSRSAYIEPKDLFSALYHLNNENINKLFKLFNITENDLENALIFSRFKRKIGGLKRLPASLTGFLERPFKVRHRVMNRAWTARPTPFLDAFGEDLTDLARMESVGFLIGHEKEYDQLLDILSKPGKPNALLIGDPGAGKTTLVAHLAYEIIKDRVPPPLFDKRLVSLDISRLVSGAESGEIASRIERIISEIISAGNIILYIPEIHNLLKTGGATKITAADLFLPAFKGSSFAAIGATASREYKQYIETNSDFASAFETIKVEEIDEATATRYLSFASIVLEIQHKIIISFGAIKQAVILAHKYFRQKLLPSSAEDLLKEALADASQKRKKILTADDIINIAQRKINIPLSAAKETEAEQLLNLEKIIHERLVDQEKAVEAVARALREYRSGLSRKGGPIATFLFIGPTGVGKTELAKILTKIQFGSTEMMVRLDMSEYQEKQSIFRLIGMPDGATGGTLTDAIREKPYSLILLDEFEKAHPDILNVFLQVFDDGRLTDSLGRTIDFQNTIIIATSNAHSTFVKEQIEKSIEIKKIAEELKKKLTDYFKPELINRFSEIVVFKNLSPDDILKIAKILLKDLVSTLSESHGIELNFDESVVRKIAEIGYDPVFGARPLRGVISDKIRSVLAEKILRQEISRGDIIKIIFENEIIKFQKLN